MTPRQIRRAAERKAAKQARKEANRANAQSSTGPKTEQGKAISSMNALKTALTGRTVLLPEDDRARYQQHLSYYFRLWNPVGEHECALVQILADTWWRLLRIPHLEAALHAKGRAEGLDELETWLKYEKQFRNLALQERRLSNYAIRLRAELEEYVSQREAGDEAETETSDTIGFEFSPRVPNSETLPLESVSTPAEPSMIHL